MKLSIITVHRKEVNYIDGTLESLQRSDWAGSGIPVTLYVGRHELEYVDKWRNMCGIVPWEGEVPRLHVAFVMNYARALGDGTDDVVVAEDDVVFSPTWLRRLRAALTEISSETLLWRCTQRSDLNQMLGEHYRTYPGDMFYGTIGMYYPAHVTPEVQAYMRDHRGGMAGRHPYRPLGGA